MFFCTRMFTNASAARADGSVETVGRGRRYLSPHHDRILAIAEWVLLVVLLTIFVERSFWPAWGKLNSEFPNYYLAAELYHQNIPLDRVYEWTWFQRQNDHLGVYDGLVSFAPNPPTSVLALIPLARLRPLSAKRVWLGLSLGFLVFSLSILHQVTQLGWRRLLLISSLCILPLHIDFLYGRPYVFLLFLICAAYYASYRNRDWLSGTMWGAAAAMKLFPALAIIFFVRKRNWRAIAGFVMGAAALVAISILLLGGEVHRVFAREIARQASRGDWLGPYVLAQNSFITLWSHLFLFEPDLNTSPLINSPALYAIAIAMTVTILVFAFLLSITDDKAPQGMALQWAALIPLLLLLSTTTAPDYSCLLIFTAIVGFDALLATENRNTAVVFLLLYSGACAPVPLRISNWFPLSHLVAMTALFALLLRCSRVGFGQRRIAHWVAAGLALTTVLTLYNLQIKRNRAEDFGRRVATPAGGYRVGSPVPLADGMAFTEMQPRKYELAVLSAGIFRDIPMRGDVLSVAGAGTESGLYSELSDRQSLIVRPPIEGLRAATETITEGQEPALSHNGKWLAFIREELGSRTAWLSATDFKDAPQPVLPSAYKPLEVTVTDEGDVIAAAGNVSDPHLLLVRRGTHQVTVLLAFPHPARFPAVSPDAKRLAFSRLDGGSWHLFVHEFASGFEQQLTHGSCNAISSAWQNNIKLLYATDCGRGVGVSAIASVGLQN